MQPGSTSGLPVVGDARWIRTSNVLATRIALRELHHVAAHQINRRVHDHHRARRAARRKLWMIRKPGSPLFSG